VFDPKELLDMLVKGANPPRSQAPAAGSSDIANDIGDLLRQFTQGGPAAPQAAPGAAAGERAASGAQAQSPFGGGSLNDLLGELQRRAGGAGETAGDIFGQATDGVREGAGKIGQATGLDDLIGQMSGGRTPQELLEQVQKYMGENQLGAGAILGGLGALILGTQTGRSIAVGAAKVGALALIGGLAYKAYQNYAQGRPLITDRSAAPEAAPAGSGFDEASVSSEATMSYIRAMIAADEQQRIVGGLKEQGLDASAEEFLAGELNNPASIASLVEGTSTEAERIQLYTAARIAIDPDTPAEQGFLAVLASELGLAPDLVEHINATARSATT
jgi:uncharacterized membrane protein YebE (DUF533 family)